MTFLGGSGASSTYESIVLLAADVCSCRKMFALLKTLKNRLVDLQWRGARTDQAIQRVLRASEKRKAPEHEPPCARRPPAAPQGAGDSTCVTELQSTRLPCMYVEICSLEKGLDMLASRSSGQVWARGT